MTARPRSASRGSHSGEVVDEFDKRTPNNKGFRDQVDVNNPFRTNNRGSYNNRGGGSSPDLSSPRPAAAADAGPRGTANGQHPGVDKDAVQTLSARGIVEEKIIRGAPPAPSSAAAADKSPPREATAFPPSGKTQEANRSQLLAIELDREVESLERKGTRESRDAHRRQREQEAKDREAAKREGEGTKGRGGEKNVSTVDHGSAGGGGGFRSKDHGSAKGGDHVGKNGFAKGGKREREFQGGKGGEGENVRRRSRERRWSRDRRSRERNARADDRRGGPVRLRDEGGHGGRDRRDHDDGRRGGGRTPGDER